MHAIVCPAGRRFGLELGAAGKEERGVLPRIRKHVDDVPHTAGRLGYSRRMLGDAASQGMGGTDDCKATHGASRVARRATAIVVPSKIPVTTPSAASRWK